MSWRPCGRTRCWGEDWVQTSLGVGWWLSQAQVRRLHRKAYDGADTWDSHEGLYFLVTQVIGTILLSGLFAHSKMCLREQDNFQTAEIWCQITKREKWLGTLEGPPQGSPVTTGFINQVCSERNKYTGIPTINSLFWNNVWFPYLLLKHIQRQETSSSREREGQEAFHSIYGQADPLKSKHKVSNKIANICILLKS